MRVIFARLISIPFVAGAAVVFYLAWRYDKAYAPWMAPFLVLLAVIYTLAPQINWWWYKRRPPALEKGIVAALERLYPPYQRLTDEQKKRFRGRVALIRMGLDWTPVKMPDDKLPEDLQTVIAAQMATVSFAQQSPLLTPYETVVISRGAIVSPEYPFPHLSELFEPDFCFLFSAENVMECFVQSGRQFYLPLYEFSRAFAKNNHFPDEQESPEIWDQLERVSGFSKSAIETTTGLPNPDLLAVKIHHYFIFRDAFTSVFPADVDRFQTWFDA